MSLWTAQPMGAAAGPSGGGGSGSGHPSPTPLGCFEVLLKGAPSSQEECTWCSWALGTQLLRVLVGPLVEVAGGRGPPHRTVPPGSSASLSRDNNKKIHTPYSKTPHAGGTQPPALPSTTFNPQLSLQNHSAQNCSDRVSGGPTPQSLLFLRLPWQTHGSL